MADNQGEVLAAIGRVDEKVEKLGTTTGILQIDVAVMKEKLKNTAINADEAKREARKTSGRMSAGVAAIISAIGAAATKLTGG